MRNDHDLLVLVLVLVLVLFRRRDRDSVCNRSVNSECFANC
jgi:hypothetical protein